MTLVTDILTSAQIAELRALRASLPQSQTIPGKWFPVYDKLYQFITVPGLGGLADAPLVPRREMRRLLLPGSLLRRILCPGKPSYLTARRSRSRSGSGTASGRRGSGRSRSA